MAEYLAVLASPEVSLISHENETSPLARLGYTQQQTVKCTEKRCNSLSDTNLRLSEAKTSAISGHTLT